MEKAISYEVQRQTHILKSGGCVLQETLRFLPEENRTEPMRNKEDAKDYRFFPEPDLCAVTVSEKDVSRLQASLPELPQSKEARYQQDFGLTREDARLLVRYQKIAEYFEKTASTLQKPKNAANFIVGAVFRRLKTETEKEAVHGFGKIHTGKHAGYRERLYGTALTGRFSGNLIGTVTEPMPSGHRRQSQGGKRLLLGKRKGPQSTSRSCYASMPRQGRCFSSGSYPSENHKCIRIKI